jgi:NAD(P)-dependent dehydrogenase (short-subunit alcohol dehydrogenase family)
MATLKELMCLKGRRALITGANGNLGKVIADTLAELGSSLILVDRPGSDFKALEAYLCERWAIKAISLEYDLESEEQRNTLIKAVKADGQGLNILVNNAAFVGTSTLRGWSVPFEKQTLGTWRKAVEVNLTTAFHLCQAFLPELRASKNSSVINIASIYGLYGPDWSLYENTRMGNPAAYAVSKGGMIQLTRWLSTTIAPHVRVNTISPGGIFRNQPDEFVQKYNRKVPLGRMATEEDFRGAIGFLASDLSAYITGQNLMVDGGWGTW